MRGKPSAAPARRKPSAAPARGSRAWAVAALTLSLLFLSPLVVMLTGSVRPAGLPPPRGIELVPASPTLEGYRTAFAIAPLARALLNSVVVAAVFVPVAVLTASWAGYGLSQLGARSRRSVAVFLLVVLMVPASALWLTRFAMFKAAALTDTYVPLVAPAVIGGSPFFVFLYWLAFRRIPRDVLDAARLEGATHGHVWRAVGMPLVRGTTVAVALLAFATAWASFIDPLVFLNSERLYTAPLVLRSLEQLGPTNWPVILAGATVTSLPVIAAFGVALRLIVPRKGAGWLGG